MQRKSKHAVVADASLLVAWMLWESPSSWNTKLAGTGLAEVGIDMKSGRVQQIERVLRFYLSVGWGGFAKVSRSERRGEETTRVGGFVE